MLIIWLIVWLLNGTPTEFASEGTWDNWAVALVICAAIDIFGTRRAL